MTEHIKYKEKINKIIEEQGYYSLMNNTKWKELKVGVSKLDFQPPFSIKTLDEEEQEEYHNFNEDVHNESDWGLYLDNYLGGDIYATPYFAVEYIKVRPRLKKDIGKLVNDIIIKDKTEEFLSILHKYNIPYEEENGTIIIYGYKKYRSKKY